MALLSVPQPQSVLVRTEASSSLKVMADLLISSRSGCASAQTASRQQVASTACNPFVSSALVNVKSVCSSLSESGIVPRRFSAVGQLDPSSSLRLAATVTVDSALTTTTKSSAQALYVSVTPIDYSSTITAE